MQSLLIILAAVMALASVVQIVAIVKLVPLRKRLGHLPRRLETQPAVRVWMRVCRSAWLLSVLAAIFTPILTGKDGLPYFTIGLLVSVILMIIAATVADNSHEYGDGSSGE